MEVGVICFDVVDAGVIGGDVVVIPAALSASVFSRTEVCNMYSVALATACSSSTSMPSFPLPNHRCVLCLTKMSSPDGQIIGHMLPPHTVVMGSLPKAIMGTTTIITPCNRDHK
eukprot:scaffold24982_cov65-Attheya_sp.AAC.5